MEARFGDTLFENAQRIFDVAQSGREASCDSERQDFALLIKPDGALHFVMESPFSIEAAAIHAGAQTAYRITRSQRGVRVEGHSASRDCVIEQRDPCRTLLSDLPLYRITSPLLISAGSAS
jgi:hypothetical protein